MKRRAISNYWRKFQRALRLRTLSSKARRLVIAFLGGSVLLVGVAMILLPGPAVIVVPLGLAILATEFAWARRAFRKTRNLFKRSDSHASSK
jgi:tellurite resistance protein TerC